MRVLPSKARRSSIGPLGGIALATGLASCGDLTPSPDDRARALLADTSARPPIEGRTALSPDGRYRLQRDAVDEVTEQITITTLTSGRSVRVIRIGEADPGSGRSYFLAWTRDGTGLLIWGLGAPTRSGATRLCLVYRLAEHALWSDPACAVRGRD